MTLKKERSNQNRVLEDLGPLSGLDLGSATGKFSSIADLIKFGMEHSSQLSGQTEKIRRMAGAAGNNGSGADGKFSFSKMLEGLSTALSSAKNPNKKSSGRRNLQDTTPTKNKSPNKLMTETKASIQQMMPQFHKMEQ